MNKTILLLLIFFTTFSLQAQQILLQENFQDWNPEQGLAPVPPSTSSTGIAYSLTKK